MHSWQNDSLKGERMSLLARGCNVLHCSNFMLCLSVQMNRKASCNKHYSLLTNKSKVKIANFQIGNWKSAHPKQRISGNVPKLPRGLQHFRECYKTSQNSLWTSHPGGSQEFSLIFQISSERSQNFLRRFQNILGKSQNFADLPVKSLSRKIQTVKQWQPSVSNLLVAAILRYK